MPLICVVEKATLNIPYVYEASEPMQHAYGGSWGQMDICIHMVAPDGLKRETMRAVRLPVPEGAPEGTEGEIVLEEDPAKVQALLEARWVQLRQERNARLAASDWSQLADVQLSEEKKQAWTAYRQALRNLPAVTADPYAPVWPEMP